MSYSKKIPVYRYFQVRLKKLSQPTVLGSAIALGLLLIGAWQYWSHPEWLRGNNNNTNQLDSANSSTLSPGDIAAIADIDNSSVLNQQLNLPLFSQPLAAPNQKYSATKADNLLETINPQQSVAQIDPTSLPLSNIPSYQQNVYNPFADLTPNISSSNLVALNNNSLSLNPAPNQYSSPNSALTSNPSSNFNGFNPLNPTTNAAPVSALQAALSQLTPSPALITQTPIAIPNQQQTAVNQPQIISPSTINNYNLPATSATAYPNSFPSNDYTYLNRPVIPPSIPNAVPGNPNNFNQPTVQNPNQLNGFNNPGSTPTTVNPGLPPSQLNQSNFSTPGVTSGSENGQNSNIFSNP
ncbi:MAG TPA: hypothetical protein V6D15_06710 [Oculatellaceae cyanobacterium]|jgi:hypothetical protein